AAVMQLFRRTMADDPLARCFREHGCGAIKVDAKFFRRKLPDGAMIISAACDLVPASGDLAHKVGILLGYPAEDEERRLCVKFVEQVERLQRILLVSRFEMFPVALLYERLESADVEIVLDEYRQEMPRP